MSVLEALVLQRIIKIPNSWERDPNLSLREGKKDTIFLYFPWDAGAQIEENFTVLDVTQSESKDITFAEWVANDDFIFIYKWPTGSSC